MKITYSQLSLLMGLSMLIGMATMALIFLFDDWAMMGMYAVIGAIYGTAILVIFWSTFEAVSRVNLKQVFSLGILIYFND